jgi:membrane-bound inhibitor of C-type lysozyme
METVVALLMFVNFEIKEHRIQESMGMCLRGKREAERQYSETVTYKCIKTQAEVEINKDGSKSIKKIVLNN